MKDFKTKMDMYTKFNAPMKNGVVNAIFGHLEGLKSQRFTFRCNYV